MERGGGTGDGQMVKGGEKRREGGGGREGGWRMGDDDGRGKERITNHLRGNI